MTMPSSAPTPSSVLHARNSRPGSTSRVVTVIAWVLQVGLAFFIGSAGLIKLAGDAAMVTMFADIGAGQWLRSAVGALEVAGAIGLLIPRLRALAPWASPCSCSARPSPT